MFIATANYRQYIIIVIWEVSAEFFNRLRVKLICVDLNLRLICSVNRPEITKNKKQLVRSNIFNRA